MDSHLDIIESIGFSEDLSEVPFLYSTSVDSNTTASSEALFDPLPSLSSPEPPLRASSFPGHIQAFSIPTFSTAAAAPQGVKRKAALGGTKKKSCVVGLSVGVDAAASHATFVLRDRLLDLDLPKKDFDSQLKQFEPPLSSDELAEAYRQHENRRKARWNKVNKLKIEQHTRAQELQISELERRIAEQQAEISHLRERERGTHDRGQMFFSWLAAHQGGLTKDLALQMMTYVLGTPTN